MKKTIGLTAIVLALATSSSQAQFLGNGVGFAIPDNDPAGAQSSVVVPNAFPISGIAVAITMSPGHTFTGDLIATLKGPNGVTADLFNRIGLGVANFGSFGCSKHFLTGATYRLTDRGGVTNFSALGGGATNVNLAPYGTGGGNSWSNCEVPGAPGPLGTDPLNLTAGDYVASSNSGVGTTYASHYSEVNLLGALGSQSAGNWTLKIADFAADDTGSVSGWQLQLLPEPSSLCLLGLGLAAWRGRRSRRSRR